MSLNLFDLTGKVAVVTGSGKGIGKALALGMAQAGADVVVTARTESDIESTAADIRAAGRRALAIPADVRVAEQVTNLFGQAVDEFGGLDIVVNNAGGSFLTKTMEMSENAWNAIIRQNLTSTFLCSQEAGRIMREQKRGSIINMASTDGFVANPKSAAYGAAKAAIVSFTKTLAADLGPYNVRVNALAPGYIVTAGIAELLKSNAELAEKLGAKEKNILPLRRLGKPEDIVGPTIFLASDASEYVTGQTIVIDGGLIYTLD